MNEELVFQKTLVEIIYYSRRLRVHYMYSFMGLFSSYFRLFSLFVILAKPIYGLG